MDKYRRDIDGLRAVAVTPVILFHMGFQFISGGYLGVDVFFVISGYLITSIILEQINKDRFSLISFYEKRAKRILPALFFMMLLSSVAAYYVLFPHQIKNFAQSIVATCVFLSNYFFYFETDYFNQFTNHAPLLHTWSLAVEEQFYIFFPPMLMLLSKLRQRWLTLVIVGIGIVSFISSIWLLADNRSLAFYSIHTRAWELALGALISINSARMVSGLMAGFRFVPLNVRVDLLSLLGFCAIVLPMLMFDAKTQHPGFPTLIPALGTALILLLGDRPSFVHSVLCSRLAVSIGLLSYSLYIFHQPVIAFFYFSGMDMGRPTVMTAIGIIILLLSLFSYHFVEKTIRYGKALSQRVALTTAVCSICAFSAIGYYGHTKDGFIDYFSKKYLEDGGFQLVDVDAEKERIDRYRRELANMRRHRTDDGNKKILVLGDSMGGDAYSSIAKLIIDNPTLPFSVRYFRVDDECIEFFLEQIGQQEPGDYSCELGKFSLVELVDQINKADTVILAAKWQESTYQLAVPLAEYLLSENPNLNVFISSVIFFQDISSISMQMMKAGLKPEESGRFMFKMLRFDRLAVSDKLREIVHDDPRFSWIEKSEFFCDLKHQRCNLFDEKGKARIWDNAHLTYRAYSDFGKALFKEIEVGSKIVDAK